MIVWGTTLRIGVGEYAHSLPPWDASRDADRRQIDERADAVSHFAIEQVAQPGKVCGSSDSWCRIGGRCYLPGRSNRMGPTHVVRVDKDMGGARRGAWRKSSALGADRLTRRVCGNEAVTATICCWQRQYPSPRAVQHSVQQYRHLSAEGHL